MAVRLERGFLATAGEGSPGPESASDFERCLRLGKADLRDDEVFATLTALAGYYAMRADLRRTVQVLESLRAGLEQGRPWFGPVIDARFGAVAWLRGEFDAAASYLEAATAGMAGADQQQIEALWFQPNDPVTTAYVYRALVGMVRGDSAGAEAELAEAATPGRTSRLPPRPIQRRIHALREDLAAHRSRSARTRRSPRRRAD